MIVGEGDRGLEDVRVLRCGRVWIVKGVRGSGRKFFGWVSSRRRREVVVGFEGLVTWAALLTSVAPVT